MFHAENRCKDSTNQAKNKINMVFFFLYRIKPLILTRNRSNQVSCFDKEKPAVKSPKTAWFFL